MASRYGLEIRAVTGADAAGVAALLHASGHSVAASDLAERLDALRSATGTALIAVEWGPPSGLVVLHWYRSPMAAQPVAQITTLLVGPDERRRGIGRLLVKAASQAARSAGCATLELAASPDEEAMQAFCDSTGFEPVGSLLARPLRKRS
ncbi:GNAT family N-acetyltransferase [Methylobacterium marchantiae]|uniref:GNAT family N-acetyltransferase n=1 Tax=Methylobacterium marchantiae TaxID=600331 RepID=A0ABW3X1L5_9HYPH